MRVFLIIKSIFKIEIDLYKFNTKNFLKLSNLKLFIILIGRIIFLAKFTINEIKRNKHYKFFLKYIQILLEIMPVYFILQKNLFLHNKINQKTKIFLTNTMDRSIDPQKPIEFINKIYFFGWLKENQKIKVFDEKHNIISSKIEYFIARKDVAKFYSDKKLKKSGIKIKIDVIGANSMIHFSIFDNSTKQHYLLNTTANLPSFIETQCEQCRSNEFVGFIDDIKVNMFTKKLSSIKVCFLNNLILNYPILFEPLITLISNSIFWQIFTKNYLNNITYNKLDGSLINIKFIETNYMKFNKIDFNTNLILLNYDVSNDINSEIFLFNHVTLVNKRILFKHNQLLNHISERLNSTLNIGFERKIIKPDVNSNTFGLFYEQKSTIYVENAILLPSLANENYFHFLFESCINLFINISKLDKNWPVIITEETHKNIESVIGILGFENIMKVKKGEVLQIENCATFNKSFILNNSFENDINSFKYSRQNILDFSNFLKIKTKQNSTQKFDKVYIYRNSTHRNLLNRKSIKEYVKNLGFNVIGDDTLSFYDQISIFSNASTIILEGGASMANLIFVNKLTKIIILNNSHLSNYNLLDTLKSILDIKIDQIYGQPKLTEYFNLPSPYNLFHSNYKIDPKKLINQLTI